MSDTAISDRRTFRAGPFGLLRRGAVVLGAAALLQGCVLSALQDVKNEATLTSSFVRPDDPQEAIGAREHPLVLAKYGGEYHNAEAEKALALVIGRLISVSDDPSRVYKVTILNTPKVNAFALPGGYVYVTRGLLALADDSSEIAAVIAHEMGHVIANHAILRQEKMSSTQLGEDVVHEVLGDSVAARVALAANQLKLSDFSREQELQADAIGIRMIGRAGYDPFAAARFLETMQAYQAYKSGKSALEDDFNFLSNHPATPQRISLAKKHARFFGAPGVGATERDRYLAGIDGLLYGDTADEGYVRGRVFSHARLGITFTVPEGTRIDNQPKAIIVTGPGEAATRFDATVLSRWRGLEDYLKSGWVNGLREDTITVGETATGLAVAAADAQAEGWDFRIKVIRIGNQVYRFITAAPAGQEMIAAVSDSITDTFRQLNEKERQALAPLRIRIETVKEGESLGQLAAKMKGTDEPLKLLRLINGLGPGDLPEPGSKIKIVTDS
ncbi:MAG: M48 family metalloprotease [Salaquimonas sp.]|nr:M48 family metalloprotease [Salaquimonas sp.]